MYMFSVMYRKPSVDASCEVKAVWCYNCSFSRGALRWTTR